MFKNKIYNYITLELIKSFVLILFSLSLIAWTVRAVNFLDLIVDSGYSTSTYFIYSLLNLTNIMTKFIPLSFLLALASFNFKKNSEIITPNLTFSTTIAPIYQLGLIPHFIGVEKNKFLADPAQIEKCINIR